MSPTSLLALLLPFLIVACSRSPEVTGEQTPTDPLAPIEASIRALTDARTRVIWLRDTGDGSDYLARGDQLVLVGLDTDDRQGPRVLLPAGRNIAKPMFTVDGDRIVYSDRHEGTMHILDWEGGEPETLGNGFVLLTWRDRDTGIEWLYYAKDLVDDGKILPTHEAIFRKALPPYPSNLHTFANRIRGGLNERRVWAQTQVSEDSYQLSADGRFASAPFPWPEVGVQDIEARRWNRHGRGCWVAMSPDNSYLFWILDGPHRNLIMERIGGPDADRWPVRINELPSTDQYEVYHPRWSNHPRILAVTGPYKVGEGAYRLPGGGADVEVHLGRFTEDHRAIEHWIRITHDDYANFYPDVWVEPAPGVDFAQGTPPITSAPDRLAWPSQSNELIFLWEHGAAQNEVTEAATDKRRIFRPEPSGYARFGHRHAMWVTDGFFKETEITPPPATFSVELLLNLKNSYEESLVTGFDPGHALLIRNGEWVFAWDHHTYRLGSVTTQPDTHVALSVSGDQLRFYLQGELQTEVTLQMAPGSPKDSTLYFGGHPDLTGNAPDRLEYVAWYARALDAQEIALNEHLIRERLNRFRPEQPQRVRARVVETSATPSPADIAPYRRALVVNEYEITEGDRAGERLLAAHWAILDGIVLESADRAVNAIYTLALERFDERPELEGERLAMDSEDFTLELYYDLNL